MAKRIITLLTDFGCQDGFIGMMKGIMLGINPNLTCVDITHEISPGNIFRAGLVLQSSWQWFPAHTIHVIVVDPGVGSGRKALVCEYSGHVFIAPDNGVLECILQDGAAKVYELNNTEYFLKPVSATFHGRDIFAPTAAYLSLGESVATCGPRISDPIRSSIPQPYMKDGWLHGEIVYIDRFGNCFSNITAEMCAGKIVKQIVINGVSVELVETYASVADKKPLAVFASHSFLEIAVRNDSAARVLDIMLGSDIQIKL